MITLTWHLILYMLIEIAGFVWAITLDDESSYGLSSREVGIVVWIIGTIILTLIYGGIFWW